MSVYLSMWQGCTSGSCVDAVTAITRFVWVQFRECGEFLCAKCFYIKPNETVHKSCVRPMIPYWR